MLSFASHLQSLQVATMQYISKGIFTFLFNVFLLLVLNFEFQHSCLHRLTGSYCKMNYTTLKAENPVKNILPSGIIGVKIWQVLSKTCLELLKTKVQLLSVVSFCA